MARVASTSTAIVLPRLHPYSFCIHNQSPRHLTFGFHLQNRNRRFPKLCSQTNPMQLNLPLQRFSDSEKQVVEPGSEIDSRTADTAVSETAQPASPGFPVPDKKINTVIAASTFAAFGLFLNFGASLKERALCCSFLV